MENIKEEKVNKKNENFGSWILVFFVSMLLGAMLLYKLTE